MCERCHTAKDEIWAEVHDLVAYEDGPLSTALKTRIETRREFLSDTPMGEILDFAAPDAWTAAEECVRATMIAQRLAFIASFGDSHYHGEAPSLILGTWTNDLKERELLAIFQADTLDDDTSTPLDVYRLVLGNMIEDAHDDDAV